MGAVAEAVAGAVSGVADIGFGLYDRYYQAKMNERDFDYQKALQQQIFEREDNAVQRRRADLEAAGLNPNLAAGSAAGAGSVVGRSSTPGLPKIGNPIGTALDTQAHVIQNRILREEADKAKAEAKIAKNNASVSNYQKILDETQLMQMLGVPIYKFSLYKDDNDNVHFNYENNFEPNKLYSLSSSPVEEIFKYQLQNQKNAADMLQKDSDFYTADKIANYLGVGASMFSNAGRGWSLFNNKQYRR